MAIISPILNILLLFLNVFDTFKTLKAPAASTRNKGRPSVRAITQRKRDMKGLLTLWIVWSCLLAYEKSAERFIRVFIPFYDEFKSMLLLLLMVTRAKTSEPIYLHIIRPAIKPHVATVDPILDVFTGTCDFILFVLSIPFQESSSSATADVLTPPETEEMTREPDAPPTARPRAGMRHASSKATLSTLRDVERIYPEPPFASPPPRRLHSDSAAPITSEQFWYPPSPEQSSPEARQFSLPNGSGHFHSASDSATLYHTSQERASKESIISGTRNSAISASENEGMDAHATPRKPSYERYSDGSDEDEDEEDDFNVTLQTPMGTRIQPQFGPFRLARSDDDDHSSESDSSVGPYSAVLSTNGNASSLRTRSSSSSDVDSDSDSSVVPKRAHAARPPLAARPPARQPVVKPTRIDPSAVGSKPSAYPRKRQPTPQMVNVPQRQATRGSSGGFAKQSDVDADGEVSDVKALKSGVPKMRKASSDPVPVVTRARSEGLARQAERKPGQPRPVGGPNQPKRGPVLPGTARAPAHMTRNMSVA